MKKNKLGLYDESPETVKEGVEIVSEDFLAGNISEREYLGLMLQGRVAASPKEHASYATNQASLNIPGKILPPCVNEKPKGDVQQSYSFRIFNGLMNYVFGTAYITQQTLEEQSQKSLEQKSEHTLDGMYKPGLTQIFKINTQYKRR